VREEMIKKEKEANPLGKKQLDAAAAPPPRAGSPDTTGRDSPPSPMKRQMTSSLVSTLFTHDDLKKKCLHRVEFMVALINIAVNRYVLTKQLTSVAEALSTLLEQDIKPQLDPKLFFRPDDFRKRHCYTQDVDASLKGFEPSLRTVFGALDVKGRDLISLDDWRGFCRGAELFAPDCTERDIMLCFSWSRMCVADETTERGHFKETCLPFEGFLEALCRMSVLKMTPTPEEIAEAGCKDAGAFLAEKRVSDEESYKRMLAERAPGWGAEPAQPVALCVTRLMEMIVHIVDLKTGGTGVASQDLNLAAHNMMLQKAKGFVKNHCSQDKK